MEFSDRINEILQLEVKKGNLNPLASHCSAGSGRTGTFLLTQFIRDIIQEKIDSGEPINEMRLDIPELVFRMKICRKMLNNEEQCLFGSRFFQKYLV